MATWPLIGLDISHFYFETDERNSTKLDKKHDLNILYKVLVFQADPKHTIAVQASDWPRHFGLLLWNQWLEFNRFDWKQDVTSSTKFVF